MSRRTTFGVGVAEIIEGRCVTTRGTPSTLAEASSAQARALELVEMGRRACHATEVVDRAQRYMAAIIHWSVFSVAKSRQYARLFGGMSKAHLWWTKQSLPKESAVDKLSTFRLRGVLLSGLASISC